MRNRKRKLLIIVLNLYLLVSFGMTVQQITASDWRYYILYPNGGETWYRGETYSITWDASNFPNAGDYVEITLLRFSSESPGTFYVKTIVSSTDNDGSYSWTIPTSLPSLYTSSMCKIEVKDLEHSLMFDWSDDYFSIDERYITVNSPYTGSKWYEGGENTITWSSKNVGNSVKIELYKSSSLVSTITSSTSNDGSYSWTIPSSLTSSSYYKIKITSTSFSSVNGDSYSFSIDRRYITVKSPSGGKTCYKGETRTITWNSQNAGDFVKIELYKNDSYISTIASSTSNNGSYQWAVPSSLDSSFFYKIKITSILDNNLYDLIEGYFTISDQPVISIVSPDGSESWHKVNNYLIIWSGDGLEEPVKIDLYNNESFVSSITPNTPNSGSYSWEVPLILESSSYYKIKITSTSYDDIFDYSDEYFSISNKPVININSKKGDIRWYQGNTYTISWTSDNVREYVKIELYKSGSHVETISSNTSNDGNYDWEIPENFETGQYDIKITSLSDSNAYSSTYLTVEEPFTLASQRWFEKWSWAVVLVAVIFIVLSVVAIAISKRKKEKRVLDKKKKEIIDIINKVKK